VQKVVSGLLEVVLCSSGRTEGKHNSDTSSSTALNSYLLKTRLAMLKYDGVMHQTEKDTVLNQ
jgi:hypothetical protein